jgi:hypothetical protein
MSVDYRLLARFEASQQRLAKAALALPEHWRADPRREARIINDHWIRVIAEAAERASATHQPTSAPLIQILSARRSDGSPVC